jgi:predicted signal transduction protein with EAL and GGDEF domain
MTSTTLIEALPDLVAFVRRDGVVLEQLGGRRVTLPGGGAMTGRRLQEVWPGDAAELLGRTVRRVLAERGTAEARFECDGRTFEARISAHGPERALCVIREAAEAPAELPREGVRATGREALERRAFFARLEQSVADAALREQSLAISLLHVAGLAGVGSAIDFGIAERVAEALLARLPAPDARDECRWYVGRLADDVLGAVIEGGSGRESVREIVQRLNESVAEPVAIGDATFRLQASAGVAVRGEDGNRPRTLLEHARNAMHEARRQGGGSVHFYSDTLRLHSLARLDVERELRRAIDEDALALRYAVRADLATGAPVAVHAYLRWPHPLRGEVRAAEFLPIAEGTGLAGPLSRWALARLRRDLPRLRERVPPGVRWSFGALRQHLASDALAGDIAQWLRTGEVAPAELELRISEHALGSLPAPGDVLRRLEKLGVSLSVDEFGRGYTSLPRLARLPLASLQLDRSLAVSAADDAVARRAAAAALSVAVALDLRPVATGVDTGARKQELYALGWREGLGDCFGDVRLDEPVPERAAARRPRRARAD